jgi:squalene-hopene/tetraprenyl-beta-curcumene cyclase
VNLAGQSQAAIGRAIRWLAGMQSKNGGWGAFDADNTWYIVTRLPFCDFGAAMKVSIP